MIPKSITPARLKENLEVSEHLKKTTRHKKSKQRPGTDTIITQIQPSKPKWEISKITNSIRIQSEQVVNQVSSYFPNGGHSIT